MRRHVTFLIYPQFQLLDLTGPLAVFEGAERASPGSFQWDIRAAEPGFVASSSGVEIAARGLGRSSALHTVIAVGGFGTAEAALSLPLMRFLRSCHRNEVRLASVCTGSELLAAAGLLGGKGATTHWYHSKELAKRFPDVLWQPDKIYIREGNLWTSAGVSAGIDLALALITQDCGEKLARLVARHLVVYYRRPGGQSQFSSLLEHSSPDGRFEALLDYLRANLSKPLTVQHLAARMGMSERNFSRTFRRETGHPPANTVERLRAEAARTALESGARSIAQIAEECGFGDPERMRRSFIRQFGRSPASLKGS